MMWIYIVTILLIPVVYIITRLGPYLNQVRKCWNAVWPLSPVSKPHWLLGILPYFKGPCQEGINQFVQWTKEKPYGFGFIIPFRPALMVHHPDTVKVILKSSEPKGMLTATGSGYTFLVPWLGDGLLNSSGVKWQRNRRLLTPGFHFDVLKPYITIYNECAEKMMDIFHRESHKSSSVDIHKYVNLCTLNVILKCAFSYTEDVQDERQNSEYADAVVSITNLFIARTINPMHYIDWVYRLTKDGRTFYKLCDYVHTVADNIIQNRRQLLETEKDKTKVKRYIDFLDILLLARDEECKSLSDIEIRDEVDTFLFEGHDTTSSGINWILYNLAKYEDIQKKVQAELDDLLRGRENPILEWDDMSQIPYTTRCIKESLRTHPPVPTISRELTKPISFNGYEMPEGSIIDINIYNLHHNPAVWGKDHDIYNPDRFLPDEIAKMDPYAYIPFSAGPRNCIGQVFALNELKVITGRILHRFCMKLEEGQNIEIRPDAVIRPIPGIKIQFAERK